MIFPIAALPLADEPIETGVDDLPLEGIDKHALNDTLLQLATDQYLVIMPKVFYLRLAPFRKVTVTCLAAVVLLSFKQELFGLTSDA